KNIVITDEAAQQQNSDKTSAEAIAAIHTDTSSEDYAAKAGYLANNFDKEKVLNELNIQVEVNKEFRQIGIFTGYDFSAVTVINSQMAFAFTVEQHISAT
ncbi:hypothetical protein SASC598P14_000430, partial [Snodgrassella alvi SCGC AB-598-P14]